MSTPEVERLRGAVATIDNLYGIDLIEQYPFGWKLVRDALAATPSPEPLAADAALRDAPEPHLYFESDREPRIDLTAHADDPCPVKSSVTGGAVCCQPVTNRGSPADSTASGSSLHRQQSGAPNGASAAPTSGSGTYSTGRGSPMLPCRSLSYALPSFATRRGTRMKATRTTPDGPLPTTAAACSTCCLTSRPAPLPRLPRWTHAVSNEHWEGSAGRGMATTEWQTPSQPPTPRPSERPAMRRRYGLVFHGHALVYGLDHGFGTWLPHWVRRRIVRTWNTITCVILGHGILVQEDSCGDVICTNCCRSIRDPGEGVLRVWEFDESAHEAEQEA